MAQIQRLLPLPIQTISQEGEKNMIHVVNKKSADLARYARYGAVADIMRGTALGNPFPLTKYTRSESLVLYRKWLWEQMQKPESKAYQAMLDLAEMAVIDNLCLVCCCKPLACHGDIVKAAIEWMIVDMPQPVYEEILDDARTPPIN